MHFGMDGKLYAAHGDNANGSNAQSLNNLLGKIIRMNPVPGATAQIPNVAPVVTDDVVTLAAGQSTAVVSVLGNDTDADGDDLTVTLATSPTNGTATVNSDGTVTYIPTNATVAGSDSFTYTVTDEVGNTDTATVST